MEKGLEEAMVYDGPEGMVRRYSSKTGTHYYTVKRGPDGILSSRYYTTQRGALGWLKRPDLKEDPRCGRSMTS